MAIKLREKFNNAKIYFRATEAVSKPIAFLMAFFGVALLFSIFVGVFLFGRWGYKKVVNVNDPVVVTVQENKPASDTKTTDTSPTEINKPADTSTNKASTSQSAITTKVLPDTGASLHLLLAIALIGSLFHQIYIRLKLKN